MSKKTVLIVDDAYFMRNLIKKALKESKEIEYDIIGEAKNGKEGIKLYFELKPDIVTMDINMPDMSGIEVTKQILSKDPNAKIIAVSGNTDDSITKEMMDAGALEYLKKPFQPAFLWSKLDKIFEPQEVELEVVPEIIEEKQNTNAVIIEPEDIEDSFEDQELEILDKPDESKQTVLTIENEEDIIEFPVEFTLEEDMDKNSLSEENLNRYDKERKERFEKEKQIELEREKLKANANISHPTSIPTLQKEIVPEKQEYSRPFKQEVEVDEEEQVFEVAPKKPNNYINNDYSDNDYSHNHSANQEPDYNTDTPISIKPPRSKILRDRYYDSSVDEYQPEANNNSENNSNEKKYDNSTTEKVGFFSKVKKLFKK